MTDLEVCAVDADRWRDVVTLFGPSGVTRGCWCMARRLSGTEFRANGGEGNRAALEALVCVGEPVGLLGYADGEPVTWCAVAPRPEFRPIVRSTTLPIDDPEDATVWAVACLFVRRGHRRQGLTSTMVRAAVEYAGARGARIVEAYPAHSMPADPSPGKLDVFLEAGFDVYARDRTTSKKNVVVRRAP